VDARNACALGAAWFGDGAVPVETRVNGPRGSSNRRSPRPQDFWAVRSARSSISPETSPAKRSGKGSPSPIGCTPPSTASPRRPRRQRSRPSGADALAPPSAKSASAPTLVVFWAVDPSARYPRYGSRYAVESRGVATPRGRNSRTLIAVDVGEALGPAEADGRVAIASVDEVDGLGMMRAAVQGRAVEADARFRHVVDLARRMTEARYVAIVADSEPGTTPADPARAEALVTLAQALNAPTRCALSHAPRGRQPLRRGRRAHVADRVSLRRGLRARVPNLPPAGGRSRSARRRRGGRRARHRYAGEPPRAGGHWAYPGAERRDRTAGPARRRSSPAVAVDTRGGGDPEGGTACPDGRRPAAAAAVARGLRAPRVVTVRALRNRPRRMSKTHPAAASPAARCTTPRTEGGADGVVRRMCASRGEPHRGRAAVERSAARRPAVWS